MQYDYAYDSTDRLISSTITDKNTNQRKAMFEYNFDLNNNLSKFITLTPTGHNKILYTYGEDNLLKGMTLNNQTTLNFEYDGIGRPASRMVNLIHPIKTTYTYHGIEDDGKVYKNNLIRLETIGNDVKKDFTYLYNYDKNDNITKIYNGDYDEQLEDYSYDSLGQMTKAEYLDRDERHEYTYDNGGNITEEKVYDTSGETDTLTATNTYTYGDDSWGDLLTAYNGDTITYDSIGNPLNYRDGISFTWSSGRQLQSYTKDNNTANYTYDSDGMRLSKTVNGTKYTYLYQNGLLVQETIGEKILDYSYTAGGQILSVRYKTNANDGGTYYYYALNSRGDVIGLYDSGGNFYAKYTYDAWGNPVSVTNANGVEITDASDFANFQPIRYRSYYYDTDTGLYYLQSRYYDPVTHRFINADGLVSTGTGVLGHNMFAYCNNNPVMYCDFTGNCTIIRGFQEELNTGKDCGFTLLDVTMLQRQYSSYTDYSYQNSQTYRDVTEEVNAALKSYLLPLKSFDVLLTSISFLLTTNELLAHLEKYSIFVPLVYNECPWDIKNEDSWKSTIGTEYPGQGTKVLFNNLIMTPEDLGNYTYGTLGRSLGLSLDELLFGSYVVAGCPTSGSRLLNELYDQSFIIRGYYY